VTTFTTIDTSTHATKLASVQHNRRRFTAACR